MVWLATGAMDRELASRAFWLAILPGGSQVSEKSILAMHPLRRLEQAPEERGNSGDAGWAVLGAGLRAINNERGK